MSRAKCSMPGPQRGIALIVALLVLAIAAGLAAGMISANQQAIDHTTVMIDGARADQLTDSALVLARALLEKDSGDVDSRKDIWAKPYDNVPVEGGTISLHVVDLQGRFNINSLITPDGKTDPQALARFKRLLQAVKIAPSRAEAVLDWIDANQTVSQGGAEDGAYRSRTPAYLAANRPMVTVTTLRSVAGISAQDYAKLAPHLSALPVGAPVNLNDADGVVLTALGANNVIGIRSSQDANGQSSEDGTNTGPVAASVSNFLNLPIFSGNKVDPGGLSVNSHYFLCAITVTLGDVVRHRYVVLERRAGKSPRIIAMSNKPCLTGHYCI